MQADWLNIFCWTSTLPLARRARAILLAWWLMEAFPRCSRNLSPKSAAVTFFRHNPYLHVGEHLIRGRGEYMSLYRWLQGDAGELVLLFVPLHHQAKKHTLLWHYLLSGLHSSQFPKASLWIEFGWSASCTFPCRVLQTTTATNDTISTIFWPYIEFIWERVSLQERAWWDPCIHYVLHAEHTENKHKFIQMKAIPLQFLHNTWWIATKGKHLSIVNCHDVIFCTADQQPDMHHCCQNSVVFIDTIFHSIVPRAKGYN